MARKTLTDKGVAAIKPRAKTYTHSDPMLPGHYVRVNSERHQIICRCSA